MLFVCLSSINTKNATTTTTAAKYNGNEIKSNAHLDWTNSILYIFFKSRTKGSTQIQLTTDGTKRLTTADTIEYIYIVLPFDESELQFHWSNKRASDI